MILVDKREGSKDLTPLFTKVTAIPIQLEFGDASFSGRGPGGPLTIGVERKRIGDLLSSIANGRLSGHQLPGMLEMYDISYIIVEGIIKADPDSDELLHSPDGGHSWRLAGFGRQVWTMEAIQHYLFTLEMLTGVKHRFTRDAKATVRMIEYLHSWWNKPYEKHAAHMGLHKGKRFDAVDQMITFLPTGKPTLCRRFAAELDHIGISKSIDVDHHFGSSVQEMFEASKDDWRKIPGVGKGIAEEVYNQLHDKLKKGK